MRRVTVVLLAAATACAEAQQVAPAPNTLSAEEQAAGFRLLFDGTSMAGWRGFRMDSVPAGWEASGGILRRVSGGGDLITTDQFADFELRLEWRVRPGGNSGIFFRVTEDAEQTYHTGPEMQVLDDSAHADGTNRLTSAGSNYGLHPAPAGIVRPAGQWNEVRLVVDSAHVEHWLNGTRVVEYELWSPEWETLVRNSKFMEWPGYGRARRGHIALQDHGDTVEYRSIRLRVLP